MLPPGRYEGGMEGGREGVRELRNEADDSAAEEWKNSDEDSLYESHASLSLLSQQVRCFSQLFLSLRSLLQHSHICLSDLEDRTHEQSSQESWEVLLGSLIDGVRQSSATALPQ